jgi:hypothetical protein
MHNVFHKKCSYASNNNIKKRTVNHFYKYISKQGITLHNNSIFKKNKFLAKYIF